MGFGFWVPYGADAAWHRVVGAGTGERVIVKALYAEDFAKTEAGGGRLFTRHAFFRRSTGGLTEGIYVLSIGGERVKTDELRRR